MNRANRSSTTSTGRAPGTGRRKPARERGPFIRWTNSRLLGGTILVSVVLVSAFLLWPERSRLASTDRNTWSSRTPARPAYSPAATDQDLKEEAFRVADELIAAYPNSAESYAVSARLLKSLGKSKRAAEFWARSSEIDPNYAVAYFGRGVIAKDSGDFEQAAPLLRKAIQLAPQDPFAPPLLAECLMNLGRFQEAVDVLIDYASSNQVSAKALLNLGTCYSNLGEFDKAKQTFEVMIAEYPEQSTAYYGLGQVYRRLGESAKAEQCIKRASILAPKDPDIVKQTRERTVDKDLLWVKDLLVKTLLETGRAYAGQGAGEAAEEALFKAAFLDAGHTECREELLRLYRQQGRDQDGLRMAEELCRIKPKDASYRYNLGVLSGQLGELEAAREAFERAIQLDPENPEYRRARELMKY